MLSRSRSPMPAMLMSMAASGVGADRLDDAHVEVASWALRLAVWEKCGPLTQMEWEQGRMHGYYSERIVATSPSLAPLVGLHHERLDGSGYHRCCTAVSIPMAARLVAVA